MNEKSLMPAIRFAGFTDAWERRKLGELAEFRRGLTYSPSDISSSGIRVLRSSNIDEDTFILADDDVYVKETAVNIPLVAKGDILITAANGSSRLVGKHALIIDDTSKMVHGGFMLLAHPYYHSAFVNALMHAPWYSSFIRTYIAGGNGAIGNLNKTDLETQEVTSAPEQEQDKIGSLFTSIDRLITLHQRKHEKLLNIKKSMLDKMFPKNGELFPEVRFSGFTAAWEWRKLGEFAEISSGIMGDSLLSNGQYRLTRIETIAEGYVDEMRIGYTNTKPHESYRLMKGDILYSNINSISHIGKVALYDSNSKLYHGINLLRLTPRQGTNSTFLLALLNTDSSKKWAQAHANQAVSQASINQSLLASQDFFMSGLEEQRKIGKLFSILNRCISLHQRKMEKLQNIKKACLEKMFV